MSLGTWLSNVPEDLNSYNAHRPIKNATYTFSKYKIHSFADIEKPYLEVSSLLE